MSADSDYYSGHYQVSIEPDHEFIVNVANGNQLKFQVYKHQLSRFSKFFERLEHYQQTSCTLDFDKEIVRSCTNLLIYVSGLIPSQFIDYLPGKIGYEEEMRKNIQTFVSKDFIECLKCLGYFQINTWLLKYIIDNYKYDTETFDMDTFVQLDFIPLQYLWGLWSQHSPSGGVMPTARPDDATFIPIGHHTTAFEDYEVVAMDRLRDEGLVIGKKRADRLHISCQIYRNYLDVYFHNDSSDEYFMSVMIVYISDRDYPRILAKFFNMASANKSSHYIKNADGTEEYSMDYSSTGICGVCGISSQTSKDILNYRVLIKKVKREDCLDLQKFFPIKN